MASTVSVLSDLERKLSTSSGGERLNILRAVTDLFLGSASQLSDESIAVFDDVLARLTDHIESRALVELSGRLAFVPNAPAGVIRRLAEDEDIRVAGPVLRHSERLTIEDLVSIAKTGPQEHLAAIAGRDVVDERVSDVLVDRGDSRVAATVAGNAGAKFSSGGISKLYERAAKEEGIAEFLASRPDISAMQLRGLVEQATEAIRHRLILKIAPEARERLDRVLTEIAADIDRANRAQPRRDYAAALRFAQSMQGDSAWMRMSLREAAQAGNVEQSIALVSVLSGVPVSVVERVLTHGDEGGALLLCKSMEFDWATASAVLAVRAMVGRPLIGDREAAFNQYKTLRIATAQKVVRFWRVRAVTAPVGDAAAIGASV